MLQFLICPFFIGGDSLYASDGNFFSNRPNTPRDRDLLLFLELGYGAESQLLSKRPSYYQSGSLVVFKTPGGELMIFSDGGVPL